MTEETLNYYTHKVAQLRKEYQEATSEFIDDIAKTSHFYEVAPTRVKNNLDFILRRGMESTFQEELKTFFVENSRYFE